MKHILRKLALISVLAVSALSFAGPKPPHVKVTSAQATKTALAKYHGKLVGKVELENEEGKWQYAVTIRSGKTLREVMVDANTGKIANVEVTTPKQEAKEKAEEAKHKKGG